MGDVAYYIPPPEKVGGHVPRVPHQIASMLANTQKNLRNDSESGCGLWMSILKHEINGKHSRKTQKRTTYWNSNIPKYKLSGGPGGRGRFAPVPLSVTTLILISIVEKPDSHKYVEAKGKSERSATLPTLGYQPIVLIQSSSTVLSS